MKRMIRISIRVGFVLFALFSIGCASLLQSKRFVISFDLQESQKPGALIRDTFIDFLDHTKTVAPVGSILTHVSIGAFSGTDLMNIQFSLQDSIQYAQSKWENDEGLEHWNLYVVIRAYMEHLKNSGKRHNLACVAWCLAGPGNQILFHEQFYCAYWNQMFTSVGNFKTDMNRHIVSRIARRALIISNFPEKTSFNDDEDPYTFDSYAMAVEHLPDISVWGDVQHIGAEWRGNKIYDVYRVGEQQPGWESTQKGDFIDWALYIQEYRNRIEKN